MGASHAVPTPPPAEDPTLTRTITHTAHEVISEQIRKDLRRARADAVRYKKWADESLADLDDALEALDVQRQQFMLYGLAATAGAALLSGALGALVMRRHQTAAVARLSQELVDLRRRGALDVAKAERFGVTALAKSLIPSLDAIDALVRAGGDEEGSRLTRSALHAALRDNGIEQVAPNVGEPFDVSVMEAMLTVPVESSPGNVESVLRPGYTIHGERVLRAAQVGVGSCASKTE